MKIVFILIALVCCVGCNEPITPSVEQANHDLDSMRFIQHKGLCFGVIRFDTYLGYQGVSVTQVSLEACR